MDTSITKKAQFTNTLPSIIIANKNSDFSSLEFNENELSYINKKIKEECDQVFISRMVNPALIHIISNKKEEHIQLEKSRLAGNEFGKHIKKEHFKEIEVFDYAESPGHTIAAVEGIVLGLYQFTKYLKDKKKTQHKLKEIGLISNNIQKKEITELNILLESVYITRDLVNEPVSYLTAPQLAKEMVSLGKEAGFSVEVFDKKKIESLKMGGLLAVNKGSIDPPRFSVLEWKPKNAKNKKPLIIVGKGVVYDTGGLSLKPTADSMDYMKCDMAGAGVVAGLFYAIAKSNLPVYVVGLVPSTDNRPDGNAYVPGDIIKMYNGMHVEVLNTDAEGRMILADALSYASKYKPQLVIDLATLTGAAHAAIGHYGTVVMGTAEKSTFEKLEQSGKNTYERTVEFPFWDEYGELIKSDVADIKNVGGKVGGAITAGKFLEHFTDYPWIHMDIAGPAFMSSEAGYLKKGGTGIGVRILFDFIKNNY